MRSYRLASWARFASISWRCSSSISRISSVLTNALGLHKIATPSSEISVSAGSAILVLFFAQSLREQLVASSALVYVLQGTFPVLEKKIGL